MERSTYVDRTLDLFRRTRARSSRIGIALQACLYRTEADLESLLPLGAAIRLVKGAYLEPPVDRLPEKRRCRRELLQAGLPRARRGPIAGRRVAAHRHARRRLIDRLGAFIDDRAVPTRAYEYAMLYGIQRPLQQRLARSGRPLRVLISYGDDWFPWYMRRLAERPANVWFVVKNLVARNPIK